jgi:hypothetical protein
MRALLNVSAVRDLWAVVKKRELQEVFSRQRSTYGADAEAFANNEPITLSNGAKLCGLHFESEAFLSANAAIGPHDCTAVLYRIKPDAPGPSWLPQIASFECSVLMKHFSVVPNFDSFIRSEEVRCMTFATLFKETGILRIDLLMIDAEGY